jgi:hypothetical protein
MREQKILTVFRLWFYSQDDLGLFGVLLSQ